MLAEVLKDIYEFDMNQLERISIPSSANSMIVNFLFRKVGIILIYFSINITSSQILEIVLKKG